MFGNIGPWEAAFIIIIALIVIGPGKLPEAGKALGKAIRSFNEAKNNIVQDLTAEKTAGANGNSAEKNTD